MRRPGTDAPDRRESHHGRGDRCVPDIGYGQERLGEPGRNGQPADPGYHNHNCEHRATRTCGSCRAVAPERGCDRRENGHASVAAPPPLDAQVPPVNTRASVTMRNPVYISWGPIITPGNRKVSIIWSVVARRRVGPNEFVATIPTE